MLWMLPMGVVAGVVTTVAGLGGGMLLLLAIAAFSDPLSALAMTAPALLLGNLHRAWLYRARLSWSTAGALVLGAMPGSVLGGLLAARLPEALLHGAMLLMAGVAVARALGWLRWTPPAVATGPVGFATGAITATGGGAGVLLGPFLLARGLAGPVYVATMAVGAVSMHTGRLVAYGLSGLIDGPVLLTGLGLAAAIVTGNLVGDRLRLRLGEAGQRRVQVGVLVAMAALAVGGAS